MSNFRRSSHGTPFWSFKYKRASHSETNSPSPHPTPEPTFPDSRRPTSHQAQWERQYPKHNFVPSPLPTNPAQGGPPPSPPSPPAPSSSGPSPTPDNVSYIFSDDSDDGYDADIDEGDINRKLIIFGYMQLMNLTKEVERLSVQVAGLERELDDCRIVEVNKEGEVEK